MKKILSLILAVIMLAAALTGCAGTVIPADTDARPSGTKSADTDEHGSSGEHGGGSHTSDGIENVPVGEKFTFGSWEQDGNKSNGAERISWIVLKQDVGKVFVLSEKILEYDYFMKPTESEQFPRGLYKDSDLRKFLIGEFYENAFTDGEKSMILSSKITTKYRDESFNDLTYDTEDKVFALSKDEAARYVCGVGTYLFALPTDAVNEANPYAMNSISGVPGVEKSMSWWLRDMGGETSKTAAFIYASEIQKYTNDQNVYKQAGVRPAMWIVCNEADMNAYAEGKIKPKEDAELNGRIAGLKVGDKIRFGKYDKDLYSMNGFEDLYWTVIDEDDGSFLIISDTNAGKGYSVFAETTAEGSNPEETSWAESYLRSYINSEEFLEMTFTPQEKAKLLLTRVVSTGEDDRNGGNETEDLLFVPDVSELEKYFPSQEDRKAGYDKYWLRSQRSWAPYIAYVSSDGSVYNDAPTKSHAIRLMARIEKQ